MNSDRMDDVYRRYDGIKESRSDINKKLISIDLKMKKILGYLAGKSQASVIENVANRASNEPVDALEEQQSGKNPKIVKIKYVDSNNNNKKKLDSIEKSM